MRFLLAAGMAAGLVWGQRPVTIEDTLRSTRPAGAPVWSPDGARFAFEEQGKLHIYTIAGKSRATVADLAALRERTKSEPAPQANQWVNRGVRERRVQWFPDGQRLLVTAGGDLFVVPLNGAEAKALLSTPVAEEDPQLSPDGRKVSFRRGVELWVRDVASGKETRLTRDGSATVWNGKLDWVYPEELQIPTAHWWSPDSRRIAYLQFDVSPLMLYPHADLTGVRAVSEPQRYPQAGTPNSRVRVGVVSAGGGKTRWLALGGPDDALTARVTWLPDSSAIAVHQLTRVQDRLRLLRADAATGKVTTILEETDKEWVNLRDDFQFLKDGSLLWSNERDGYRHLYIIRPGAEPARITGGGWEVTDLACVDEGSGRLFYVSTEVSPTERHLYSIRFTGADKKRLTAAPGMHSVSMAGGCGHYIDTWSSLDSPPQRELRTAGGDAVAILQAADRKPVAGLALIQPELLTFRGKDGTLFHARLLKPAGFDRSRKYPAIVQVYGGPHAQTVRNIWLGANWDQVLAHRGFVVWQMDNRGSAGRGHVFEAPVNRHFGKQELADQIEGLDYLIGLGFVDGQRIGVNGWSYGGYMTLTSLLRAPDRFQAGIAGAPVTDWRHYDTIYTERYMDVPARNEAGYRDSSPVNFAGNLKGKLMLVHNFEDDNVLFQHTLRMSDALQRAGKQFELMLYPQKSHGVSGSVRKQMVESMTSFFERTLKP